MKRVLIPIDFTFNSYETIDYSISFFKAEKCKFFFLNTFTYDFNGLNALHVLQANDDWFEKPKRNSEEKLAFVVNKYSFNNKNKNHSFQSVSACNELIKGIKKVVKNYKIDLVVATSKVNDKNYSYSDNIKKIIEDIQECIVMIIPQSMPLKKHPEFILASNFEYKIPTDELKKWCNLVQLVKGTIKVVVLSDREDMTTQQILNQVTVIKYLRTFCNTYMTINYLNTNDALKNLIHSNNDCIVSLMNSKPNFWSKFGLSQSKIVKFNFSQATPLIILHP